MKTFLRQFFLFLAFALAANCLLNALFRKPTFMGVYHKKWEYLTNVLREKPDALFWGSSRIYRGIVPSVFDTACGLENINSFNLGAPGTNPPESYYLYENFLGQYDKLYPEGGLRYAFMELTPPKAPDWVNLLSKKTYYWNEAHHFQFKLQYDLRSKLPIGVKSWNILTDLISQFLYLFGFNYLPERDPYTDWVVLGDKRDGYFALESEEKKEDFFGKITVARKFSLQKDSSILIKRREAAMETLQENHFPPQASYQLHLKKIKELIEKSKQMGIHLIFMAPYRHTKPELKEVMYILQQLPPEHVIEAGSPLDYPELWEVKESYDRGHLSEAAAIRFTEIVARQFNAHVRSQGRTN